MSDSRMDAGLIEELKGRLPEYLRQTGRGDAVRGKIRCIDAAHADREPSMGYDVRKKRLHCFGCGKSFDLFDVVALDDASCSTFPQQVRKVCEVLGLAVPETVPAGRSRVGVPAKTGARKDLDAFVEESVRRCGFGGAYFEKRGISQALCVKHRLFTLDGRAYLPIFRGGHCVAYCARAVAEDEPRYRNSTGAMEVFGADLLLGKRPGAVVVTESIFDALSAQCCGFEAVALCGTGNAQRFLSLCERCPDLAQRRFLLAGDADEAGERLNALLEEKLEEMGAVCVRVVLPQGCKDLNHALLEAPEALEDALCRSVEEFHADRGASLIGAARAISGDEMSRPVGTGIAGLDRILEGGLYPGLYVLGAVSSIGKTSLALQIGDSIAQGGRDVLYFTLEMSGAELVAKSLSRITAQMDRTAGKTGGLTVREIGSGGGGTVLERAVRAYEEGAGKRVFFAQEPVRFEGIEKTARAHRKRRGVSPVIVVDYLQIMQPADNRGTDKQNTDKAVVALKRLSRELGTPVLAISSFNRENYRNPVSMEAFKESGAVEYSSDVLLGLQAAGIGEARFDMNAAKLRHPRDVELVLLKNRSGAPHGVVKLRYYAKYSLFTEK